MSFINLQEISDAHKNEMIKVINYLEKHSFLMETRLNLDTLDLEDVPEHNLCSKHEDNIRDYLLFRGVELIMTSSDHTYYLSGEVMNPIKPSPIIVKILLLTKSFYDENSIKLNPRENFFTKKMIREQGFTTGVLPNLITDKEWESALSFMKMHNLITYKGSVKELLDDDKIYIYPTIAIYLNPTIIASIKKVIEKMITQPCEAVNETQENISSDVDYDKEDINYV